MIDGDGAKAAVTVNTAMLQFYWELGADIVEKQKQFAWGSGFLNQLSTDLMNDFPEVKGFSRRNLELMRQWHLFWRQSEIVQQPVSQIVLSIPWGHNLAILAKCKRHDEALYYAQFAHAHGWSRSVLVHQIESGLWLREGKAITNFAQMLPATQSPVLLLSGGADPVTPPRHGERIQKALGAKAQHIIVPEAGHGVMGIGCVRDAVQRFIQADTDHALPQEAPCANTIPRPVVFRE